MNRYDPNEDIYVANSETLPPPGGVSVDSDRGLDAATEDRYRSLRVAGEADKEQREGRVPSPRSLHYFWTEATRDAVEANGGSSIIAHKAVSMGRKVMKQEGYSDAEVIASFDRFAEAVRSKKVNVRDKPAWFMYYNRRHEFLERSSRAPESTGPTQIPDYINRI